MKKKGFTLIELLVVIAIIAMLLAILMPALNKVKRLAQRLICATNLKGMGTAMMVYANDFDDEYPIQGGGAAHTWADVTAGWQVINKNWMNAGNLTVGASLFLLVREADVSPKSFVCKSSDQKPYEGDNDNDLELVELWDFGQLGFDDNSGPENHVSYAFQLPYISQGTTAHPASSIAPAGMALMADKNPFYDDKLENTVGTIDTWEGVINRFPNGGDWAAGATLEKWQIQVTNSYPHNREGQNVLFNDGHSEFLKRPDVGYDNDNIYTFQSGTGPWLEDNIRIGSGKRRTDEGRVSNNRDAWLVNDVDL